MWMLLMNNLYLKAHIAMNDFLCDEEGDVNIVSMVVLIGIAVLLAVVFKDNIAKLVDGLFNTIEATTNNVMAPI